MLLEVPGFEQGADDNGVAEHHDYERNAEAHADLESQHQNFDMVVFIVQVDHGAKMIALHIIFRAGEKKLRDCHYHRQDPHYNTDDLAVQQSTLLGVLRFCRLDDYDVAVDTDAGEKENAAEEVDFVNGGHNFAQGGAKGPAVDGIGCPERQRAEEEEIS